MLASAAMDENERQAMLQQLKDPEAWRDLLARVEADPGIPESIKHRRRGSWSLKDRDVVLIAVLGYWQGRGISELHREALQALWEKETGQLVWSDETERARPDDADRP